MATQNQQGTLSAQVQQHGELLARLTVIVESDHKDLGDLKSSVEIIARVLAKEETIKEEKAKQGAIRARIANYVLPFAYTFAGIVAGHFIGK